MDSVNLQSNNAFSNSYEKVKDNHLIDSNSNNSKVQLSKVDESKIHNSAVNVSISMESIKVFLSIKSVEYSQENVSAQSSLMNIINNTEIYDFLSGKELDNGFSLKSIGYEGKVITQLNPNEAKELVSKNGFFGVLETSNRVSSFVIGMAKENLEALQEARNGVVKGFEQAEEMWGGKLPELSYETQERTLKIIDEKIAELLKTDAQKELENTDN